MSDVSNGGISPELANRCPDLNPYCDGTDLLHGEWCKDQAWAERMIARYRPRGAHPDFREAQELDDAFTEGSV